MAILQNILKPANWRPLQRSFTQTLICSSTASHRPSSAHLQCSSAPSQMHANTRPMCLWGYVAVAFNRVDTDRLTKVGPDRLCAEWVLKNGGAVSMIGMGGKVLRDYNSLPPESMKFRIQIVDASNSSIMKIGLEHFDGCKYIDTLVLHNCKHLEEDGLEGLKHLANSLRRLQISGCYNLNQNSFGVLGVLTKLEHLRLFDLMYVKDMQQLVRDIKAKLPNCRIDHEK